MNKYLREQDVRCYPLNVEKLLDFITKQLPPEENQQYRIDKYAYIIINKENIIETDNECCYSFLYNIALAGRINKAVSIPIRIKTKTSEGASYSLTPSFYFPFPFSEIMKSYVNDPTNLKEFMGSRFKYNPRIEKNQRELLDTLILGGL